MPIGSFRLNTLAAALSAPAPSYISATGGFQIFRYPVGSTIYRAHYFASAGTSTFTVTSAPAGKTVNALIVAGGGGGGGATTTIGSYGGGGGGGEVIDTGIVTVSAQGYSIVTASGGTAGSATSGTRGGNGGNSSAFGFTAVGGGGGGNNTTGNGGSNGGGGGTQTTTSNAGGTGTNQNGGNAFGSSNNSLRAGGGGAGAGGAGTNATSAKGGNGASGSVDSFNSWGGFYGTVWGGGGGGGGATVGTGGSSNGGAGSTNGDGSNAPGYGGGGGGAANTGSVGRTGGIGGSGLVIIRYEVASIRENNSTFTANAGGTVTASTTTGKFGTGISYSNSNTSGYGSYNFGPSGKTFNRANNTRPMTMEYWFRHNISDSQRNTMVMSTGDFSYNTFGTLELYYDSGNSIWRFRIGANNYSASGISAGTWNHIAIQGNTSRQVSIWANGSVIATNISYTSEVTELRLGAGYGGVNTPIGTNIFDEVRFSYGERYTAGSSFTAPTAAFTNDSLTLGLFHCESTTQTDDTA